MEISVNVGEYIDAADALPRVGGNAALYKKLLGRFTEGAYLSDIEQALSSGDMEEASRHAHTLKGVSANLSLLKLRSLSLSLEQHIKNSEDFSLCLKELKNSYEITIRLIAEYLKN